jgi:hypothetical protein
LDKNRGGTQRQAIDKAVSTALGAMMEPHSVAIRHKPDGPVIIGTKPPLDDLFDVVIRDRLTLPWGDEYSHIEPADREDAVRAFVVMDGLAEPRPVYGPVYQIIDLPAGVSLAKWAMEWPGTVESGLLRVLCAREGQFRVEIYPNEGKHRGRPHCKVTYGKSVAASFTIPDGVALHPGRLGPHEAAARKLVRSKAPMLKECWDT